MVMLRESRLEPPKRRAELPAPQRIEPSRQDRLLDEALLETFPASDPISPMCLQSFD